MKIYLIISLLFGLWAALTQYRRYKSSLCELFITFGANAICMPIIVGLRLAGALKSDKKVVLPKRISDIGDDRYYN